MPVKYKTKNSKRKNIPKNQDLLVDDLYQNYINPNSDSGKKAITIYPEFKKNDCYIHLGGDGINGKIAGLGIAGFQFKIKNINLSKNAVTNHNKMFNNFLELHTKRKSHQDKDKDSISKLKKEIAKSTNIVVSSAFSDFVSFVSNDKDGLKVILFKVNEAANFLIKNVYEKDPNGIKNIISNFGDEFPHTQHRKHVILIKIKNVVKLNKKNESCITDAVLSTSMGTNFFHSKYSRYKLDLQCTDKIKEKEKNIEIGSTFEINYYRENKNTNDYFSSYECKILDNFNLKCKCLHSLYDTSDILGFTSCIDGDVVNGIYDYQYLGSTNVGTITIQLESKQTIIGNIDYSSCDKVVNVSTEECRYDEIAAANKVRCNIENLKLTRNPSSECYNIGENIDGVSRPQRLG